MLKENSGRRHGVSCYFSRRQGPRYKSGEQIEGAVSKGDVEEVVQVRSSQGEAAPAPAARGK